MSATLQIYPSARAAKRFGLRVQKDDEPETPAAFAWRMEIFKVGRSQILLLANIKTLYTKLIIGPKKTSLENTIKTAIFSVIAPPAETDSSAPACEIQYNKTNNRSLIGSINDMIELTRAIPVRSDLATHIKESEELINRTPFSYLQYNKPDTEWETYAHQP